MTRVALANAGTMTNEELVIRAVQWFVTTPEDIRERQLEQLAKTFIAVAAVTAIGNALVQQ